MNFKYGFIILLLYLYQIIFSVSESITYMSTEHPEVAFFDRKYFNNISFFNKRWGRHDPRYYVELYAESLIIANNSIKLDFYFYQFLTNRYQPSFVEMHFKLCDMINSDTFFGESMRNALGNQRCPFPPGAYYLQNLSVGFVPKGFPFPKGRIYLNVSLTDAGVSTHVARAHMDIELKSVKLRKKT